ncbi:MAG: metallophosphoesterase [Ferruginibacter sp.]
MYSLIGDIHGHCDTLKLLLSKMGFAEIDGVWQHPTSKAIFVGDYVDRGPQIKETLELVKAMVDAGSAIALMGNHEYNAVAYASKDAEGNYLRSHNAVHNKQHQATLDQFAAYPNEWQMYLQWFRSLPLFLELDGLRAVHACWDQQHIDWLKAHNYFILTEDLLQASNDKNSIAYTVIEETLKGKEFNIPEAYTWFDKDGHAQTANRIKWWAQQRGNYNELLFSCPPALQALTFPDDLVFEVYPADAPPVFVGHYWLEDKYPVIQSANAACLDYSVAKEGLLVGYQWDGEQELRNEKFVYVR